MKTHRPNFDFEKTYWEDGYCVIGVDEVGRGSLAGPVHVGAACYTPNYDADVVQSLGVHDSKLLSKGKREELEKILPKHLYKYTIASSDEEYINHFGIVRAVERAVRQAVATLISMLPEEEKVFLLLDAFEVADIPGVGTNQRAIIKGDTKSLSIASAAILAKTARDAHMRELAQDYNQYGWDSNCGYGTKQHTEALKMYGACKHHRTLFIRKALGEHLGSIGVGER